MPTRKRPGDRGRSRAAAGRAARGFATAALVLAVLGPVAPTRTPCASELAPRADSDADVPTLTLSHAVQRALEENFTLTAAEHAEAAAAWAHRRALSQLLPSVSLESRYTRLDEETVERANAIGRELTMFFPDSTGELQPFTIEIPQTVFRNGYETSISAQLLLLNPALWNGVSLAGAARELAAEEVASTVNATIHQTLTAFIELLRLRSLAALQRQHVAQAEENVALAERLYDVGRYAEADVLRWRVEAAQQKDALYEQQRGVRVAAVTLENLIGADPSGRVRPARDLPPRLQAEIEAFLALEERDWERLLARPLEEIVAAHPRLRILNETARLAELEHRQSLTNFLPSIAVIGSYGWQNNDTIELDGDKAWSVSAALSVPLFTSFNNYAERQRTKSRLLETRANIGEARRGVLLAAEAARSAIRSSAAQYELATASLASARRSHEIQRNQYTLGRLSNLEWIDANLALQSAEQAHTSAYYDLVIAIADYYEARGEIRHLLEL